MIRADFDKLALIEEEGWGHNQHYHAFLLRHLPPHCEQSLEIGCGTGAFARLLARRSTQVLALDLSPQMIRLAREHSVFYPNIDFQVADVLEWPFPEVAFDCIASIATLHHLPFESLLLKMKAALRPGGTLLVLDLFQGEGPGDWLRSGIAFPVNVLLKLAHGKRLRDPKAVREAWAAHARHDTYLPVSQVRRICADVLPGAVVRKHLLWRYSLIWEKP
jgi:SAM-dependent methyltransferase